MAGSKSTTIVGSLGMEEFRVDDKLLTTGLNLAVIEYESGAALEYEDKSTGALVNDSLKRIRD